MPRSLDQILAALPPKRRAKIDRRLVELLTIRDLRVAVERTQEEVASTLGIGQDTVSRLERGSDMLLSTLRRYVEAMGGVLELVARFPDRPAMHIDHVAKPRSMRKGRGRTRSVG